MNRWDYLARLREPSTWAGFGIIGGLFGLNLAPADAQLFVQTGVGFAGLLAVFMGEKK